MRRAAVIFVLTILFALSALTLSACNGNQLIDNSNTTEIWRINLDDNPERPVFNKTPGIPDDIFPNDDEIIDPIPNNQSVFITRYEQSTQFRVPIGYSLGYAYPVIDREIIPLLRPAPIMTGDNHFRGYDQFIRFAFGENTTGNVTFILDENRDTEYLGTALVFDKDMPMMEYKLTLRGKPFFDPLLLGSSLMLLGSSFQVQEATNQSLILNGLDVEQYLTIQNDEPLKTNHKRIADSIIHYDGWGFWYKIYAGDIDSEGIILREGESLRDRFKEDFRLEAIPGLFFDIRYDGLEPVPNEAIVDITLHGNDDRIDLEWRSNLTTTKIPILGYNKDGYLWHGDDENRIHLQECKNYRDGCIKVDDKVLILGRLSGNGGFPSQPISRVLRLSSLDAQERKIVFRDETGTRLSVDWAGNISDSRYQAIAELPYLDRIYRIWVHGREEPGGPNGTNITIPDSISMDLDGIGGVNSYRVDLYLMDGLRVKLDDIIEEPLPPGSNYTLNLTFETLPFRQSQQRYRTGLINKELIRFQLYADNDLIDIRLPTDPGKAFIWDQRLILEPDNKKYAYGLTPWGSQVAIKNGIQQTMDDATIALPAKQRFAQISMGKLD